MIRSEKCQALELLLASKHALAALADSWNPRSTGQFPKAGQIQWTDPIKSKGHVLTVSISTINPHDYSWFKIENRILTELDELGQTRVKQMHWPNLIIHFREFRDAHIFSRYNPMALWLAYAGTFNGPIPTWIDLMSIPV
jgi:ribosomal protein RSM22 (predicted rRNA methylase)